MLHRNVVFGTSVVPADVISSIGLSVTETNVNDEWELFDRLKTECLDKSGCDVITIPHNTNLSDGRFARPREPDTGLPLARDDQPLLERDARLRNTLDREFELTQHKGSSECIVGFNQGLLDAEESGCDYENWKTLCRGEADDPAECRMVCRGLSSDPLFCQVSQNLNGNRNFHATVACQTSAPGGSQPNDCTSPLDYVRNLLPEGFVLERKLGVNPYEFGFVAATDTHNGIPGATDERSFGRQGHGGVLDDEPREMLGYWACKPPSAGTVLDTIGLPPLREQDPADIANCRERYFFPYANNFNSGGLTGVWARENTRSELFAALKRRETFATSGTRLRIRTLASRESLPSDICERLSRGEFPIEEGRVDGAPMGGTLHYVTEAPHIVAWAIQDPGGESPGTPLQRLELIKVWADADGQWRQKVIPLVGNPAPPQPAADCSLALSGPEQLCAVFTDREYDPALGAAYYARALENPSCRWSTWMCVDQGIDCGALDPATGMFPEPSGMSGYEGCCRITGAPGSFAGELRFITQQERAWASPIWAKPDPTR